MTDHEEARQDGPPGAVGYEEWLADCLDWLGDHEYETTAEAEELLLSRLSPLGEEAGADTPAGCVTGLPSDVYNLADADDTPARRAEILVHDLHAAAWRLSASWPSEAGDEAARPLIYPRSDGATYASAVGVCGPDGDRRAAFEHHGDLHSLACSTPEDLHRLHEALTSAVGVPLGPPPDDPVRPK